MKKKVMNIRPQEVTEGGERSVRYKGSDGQFHDVASSNGGGDNTAQEPLFLECDYVIDRGAIMFTDGNNYTIPEIIEMIKSGKKVFLKYASAVMTIASYDESKSVICFFDCFLTGQSMEQCQQRVIIWYNNALSIKTKTI